MSETVRAATYVLLTSFGAVAAVFGSACCSIGLVLVLQTTLAFVLRVLATVGEVGIAVVAAVASGFTVSLTVLLATSTSAITFPPSRIQSRLVVSVSVATASVVTSALALVGMTTFRVDVELGVAVVTSAAFAVAFASAWAVGVMSLVERETQAVGLKMTSLLQAVRSNNYHVLNLLVHLPFGSRQEESNTALLYAVKAGYLECVRVLIAAGANTNVQDAYDCTPLISAAQIGSTRMLRMLLEAGAVVNFRNRNRESALHQAAKYGHADCVRLLLDAGADVGVQDALWRTPLMLTVKHAREPAPIVRMLLGAGSYVNTPGSEHRTVLHYASARGIDIADLLKAGADTTVQDTEGNTPLHLASVEGHYEVSAQLLDAGAEANVRNYVRKTPLHLVSTNGNVMCIRQLIRRGADPLAIDNGGHCPVNLAVLGRKEQAVKFFVMENHFPREFRSHAVNPLRVALERGYFHIARALTLAGCRKSPLRERHLLVDRNIFEIADDQPAHFVWLRLCLQTPWSLAHLSRDVIRQRLRHPAEDAELLPLPKQLRDFVLLQDLDEILGITDE